MTDKEKIKAEIERRMDILYPQLPDASKVVHENISLEQADITGKYVALESLLSFIDSLPEEPVSEDLEEAAKIEAERFGNCVSKRFYFSCWLESCFKAGAKWQKEHLWKSADGDELPEYEREVVVFTRNFPDDAGMMMVAIGHRPNPDGWDGKSITTGEVKHYTPKTYDKGGWNIPNIVYWLDTEIPKEIEI